MRSFRETLWFKKGEATEDETVPLPVEDRYADDGTVSREDSQLFSVHTGGTQYMRPVVVEHEEVPGDLVALVGDLKRARRGWIAAIGGGLAMVAMAIVGYAF
jgi:hypothetical protein